MRSIQPNNLKCQRGRYSKFFNFAPKSTLFIHLGFLLSFAIICFILPLSISLFLYFFYFFLTVITFSRRCETRQVHFASVMRSFNVTLYDLGPRIVAFTTFTVYGAMGNPIVTPVVFPLLAWSYIMRFSISTALPLLTMSTVETLVSVKRTQVYRKSWVCKLPSQSCCRKCTNYDYCYVYAKAHSQTVAMYACMHAHVLADVVKQNYM